MSDPDKKKKKKIKKLDETENIEGRGDTAEAMLDMIIRKEDETRIHIQEAESESARLIEEAKMDAAAKKQKAVSAEVGSELREKKLAEAQEKAGEIIEKSQAEAAEIKERGEEQIEKAVNIVMDRILPSVR